MRKKFNILLSGIVAGVCHEIGLTEEIDKIVGVIIFMQTAHKVAKKFEISRKFFHLDTTTIRVREYKSENMDKIPFAITKESNSYFFKTTKK